ncbi:hypothetical protein NC652_037237 [Populus alba x Populus x berolinensis]|nr:hypothetical protein NC652_037237 [Populus alba x Populus x berolinensis]
MRAFESFQMPTGSVPDSGNLVSKWRPKDRSRFYLGPTPWILMILKRIWSFRAWMIHFQMAPSKSSLETIGKKLEQGVQYERELAYKVQLDPTVRLK